MTDESPRGRILREELAIDRYWNEIADGRLATPDPELDPVLTRTIRRVHALAGQPTPEPDQADRLWRELMSGYAPTAPLRLAPALPRPTNGHRPTVLPPQPRKTPARAHPHAKRVASGLSLVATLALVAALLAMFFFVYRDGRNREIVPAVQASPTAVATPATDWPMLRGNPARTGATDAAGPTGELSPIWTFTAPDILNAPVRAGGTVYVVSTAGIVYAVDAANGRQRWAFDLGSVSTQVGAYSFPMVGETTLYVAGYAGTMYALNRGDGAVRWAFHAAGIVVASPLLIDGVLYFGDGNGNFYALDAETGGERWQVALGHAFNPGNPAYADGVIYQGDADGGLYALDAVTGATIWSHQFGAAMLTPAVTEGAVYLSSKDGNFYALDAKTGAERWRYASAQGSAVFSPAVADGTVVFNLYGEGTVALDAETGAQVWLAPYQAANSTLTIADSVVYSGDANAQLLAFDLNSGTQVGHAALPGSFSSPPAVAGGVLYVGDQSGALTALGQGIATPVNQTALEPTVLPRPSATALPAGVNATFLWSAHTDGGFSLSFAPDGTIWIPNDRANAIWILDRDGNVHEKWGKAGEDPGEFNFKMDGEEGWWGDLAFAPDGSFFVAECGNERVEKFDPQRNVVLSIGSKGFRDGQFMCPSGVVVTADGDILVSDDIRDDIQRFGPDGAFKASYTGFSGPAGLNLDAQGRIVVTETRAGSVAVVTEDGDVVLRFGAPASSPDAQLRGAVDTVTDEAGNFYVADQFAQSIAVFDASGNYLGRIGGKGTGDGQIADGVDCVGYGGNGSLYVLETPGVSGARLQKFKVTVVPAPAATPAP